MSIENDKCEIDYAYLMEKYGPKKDKTQAARAKSPVYHEDGFSIQFKLSHAYKALKRQEQEAAKPNIKPRKKLTKRAINRLAAKSLPIPTRTESTPQETHKATPQERLRYDLNKYAELGRKKRKDAENITPAQYNDDNDISLYAQKREKQDKPKSRSADFWRHLMKGSSVVTYNKSSGATYVPETKQEAPRSAVTTSKTSHSGVSMALCNDSANHISSDTRPSGSAVEEWERRRKRRLARKTQQALKIRKAHKTNKVNSRSGSAFKKDSIQGNTVQHSNNLSDRKQLTTSLVTRRIDELRTENSSKKTLIHRPKSAPNLIQSHDIPKINEKSDVSIIYSGYTKTNSKDELSASEAKGITTLHPTSEQKRVTTRPRSAFTVPQSLTGQSQGSEIDNAKTHKPTKYLYDMCNCQGISKPETLTKLMKTKKVRFCVRTPLLVINILTR